MHVLISSLFHLGPNMDCSKDITVYLDSHLLHSNPLYELVKLAHLTWLNSQLYLAFLAGSIG